MQKCLVEICKDFENTQGFLRDKSTEKIAIVNDLFYRFMDCFATLKEEKLVFPEGFAYDVKHFNEGYGPMVKKFEDIEIRYLMLSEFYDFARLKKFYKK